MEANSIECFKGSGVSLSEQNFARIFFEKKESNSQAWESSHINYESTSAEEIVCPKNISTYTDLNSCGTFIRSGLNILDPNHSITELSWWMTGATVGESYSTGVNQINSYVFNEGVTVISYQGKDRYGNTINCSLAVTIVDNQIPRLISSPGNITVTNTSGSCSANVRWTAPIATDNCVSPKKLEVSSSHQSGQEFPVGSTLVKYTISDGVNVSSHQFEVYVVDEEAPEIFAPPNLINDCGLRVPDAYISWEQFNAAGGKVRDNCAIDYNSFKYVDQKSSSIYCPYTVTRTYSIADISGNVSEVKHRIEVVGEGVAYEAKVKEEEEPEVVLKSGAGTKTVDIDAIITDVTCLGGSDGVINLSLTLSNGPVTDITWSNGAKAEDISGLSAGTYSVVITDSLNSTTSQNFAVAEPNVLNAAVASTDITCNGANDGTITVSSPTGGYGTYQYRLNSGTWQNSGSFTGLSPKTYSVQIRDAANIGCTRTLSSEAITQPGQLNANVSSTDITCNGAADGTITVSSASGGYGAYQYRLNSGIWQNSGNFTGLSPNTYSVQIRDAANIGCTRTLSSEAITQPGQLNANVSSTDITCNGATDGTISISASSGGSGSFQYRINSGAWQNSENFSGLSPWNYAVEMRDAANISCMLSLGSETITGPNILTASVSSTNVSCNGTNDGSIAVTAASGGSETFQYRINGGAWQNSENFSGLTPGSYVVEICDAVNPSCSLGMGSETITEPNILTASLTKTNVTCNGAGDGTITVSSASGGYGTYAYRINGGAWQSSDNFSNLSPGNYSVEMYDAAHTGCVTALGSVTVTEPDPLIPPVVSFSQTICYNYLPAQLNGASASGGNGVYNYRWQESLDDVNWTDIMGENTQTYSPPNLINTTFYRLAVIDFGTPSCGTEYSNSVEISVVDDESPSFTVPGDVSLYADATCNVNNDPTQTGYVINPADNCTAVGDLSITYSDAAPVSDGCTGNYSFERTWTVADEKGNSSLQVQVIQVIDSENPILALPDNVSIYCSDSSHPDNTGWATSTDNCTATPAVTYADVISDSICEGRYTIIRTWTATDDCGNSFSNTQEISVSDGTGPLVTMPDLTVSCPSDIPEAYLNFADFEADGGLATDNCGNVTITLLLDDEISYGLQNKPGYCPDYVERTYRLEDPCGWHTDVIQTITINSECGCSPCDDNTEFGWVDFLGDPMGDTTFYDVTRKGKCCADDAWWAEPGAKNLRCVSYNVRIDDDAVGVQITMDAGATPDVKDWRVDCQEVDLIDGDIICLPSGGFHLFTYCKQGNNPNDISFGSVPGIIVSDDIQTRVDCQGQIATDGTFTNPRWTSISPGNRGDYDHFLDVSDPYNPVFTAVDGAPAVVKYEVCADFEDYVCSADGSNCDTVSVYVAEAIGIELDVNPDLICVDIFPTIAPSVSPVGTYVLTWYSGYGGAAGGATYLSTGPSYMPATAGAYSVTATDYESGLPCNLQTFDFDVSFDLTGPGIKAPPAPLEIQCNDPNAAALIQTWLNSATANYTNADGDLIEFTPTNDYNGITMACNEVLPVIFTAVDQCLNDSTANSTITVMDTVAPVINPEASPGTIECTTTDTEQDPAYLTWLANYGGARATDDCDDGLTWTADTATAVWSGDPANNEITVTFTVFDNCGNTDQTTATFTITDTQPPTITCPDDIEEIASLNNCEKTLLSLTDPTMNDDCSVPVLSYVRVFPDGTSDSGNGTVTGQLFPIGITSVTYTATDAAGLIASCSFNVTIVDVTPPNIEITGCEPVTENAAPNNCSKVPDTMNDPVYSDDCWPLDSLDLTFTITGVLDSSGVGTVRNISFPVGVSYVSYTVTDPDGNVAQCSFAVNIVDVSPPNLEILNCQNVSGTMDADDCFALPPAINDPLYSDDCWPLDSLVLSFKIITEGGLWDTTGFGYVSGLEFPVGVSTVTYTVTDPDTNWVDCSFTVTMLRDEIPTTSIICPPNPASVTVLAGACDAPVDLDPPTIDEYCETATYTITNDYNGTSAVVNETFPVGTTEVIWTISDNSGNDTTCTVYVEVNGTNPPVLTCPTDVSGAMDADDCFAFPPVIPAPGYSAPCWNNDSLVLSFEIVNGTWDTTGVGSVSGLEFPVGVSIVTYTVTDPDSNWVDCSFTVTIQRDEIRYTSINCPPDPSPVTVAANACDAPVSLDPPTIDEYCETATYTITNDYNGTSAVVNETFPVGTTEVIWTIRDNSGNDTTCIVYVEVNGTNPPVLTCPTDVSGTMDADDCFAFPPVIPAPGYSAPCWDTDSLVLSFEIVNGTWDTTGVGSVSGLEFPVGVSTVTYTVTDPDTNWIDCSFTVTMQRDEIPYTSINCPPDPALVTVAANACDAPVSLDPPTIDEYCETATYTITNDYNGTSAVVNETFPVGTTEVIWTISDNSGNNTTCMVYVDVSGTNLPTINCPPVVVQTLSADECEAYPVNIQEPDVDADCWPDDSLDISYVITGALDSIGVGSVSAIEFPFGVSTVTYTVTDPDGNDAECSFTVTMTRPNIRPVVITCPPDPATVYADIDGCGADVTLISPEIDDPCVTATYTLSHNSLANTDTADASGYYEIGSTTVIWTITDNFGNDTTCEQTVVVLDHLPILECPSSITVNADFDQPHASNVTVGLPNFSDNCDSLLIYIVTKPDSSVTVYDTDPSDINILTGANTYDLGVTTIEYMFIDGHGHDTVCDFTVTVLGAPDIECPPDTTVYLDGSEGTCAAIFDPGVPDLIEGVPPITWSYTINYADGTSESGSYVKDDPDKFADPLGNKIFPLGVTTIEWRAQNEAGYDTCSHWVEVIDTIPPIFTTVPYENCVDRINFAIYNPTNPNPVYGFNPNLEKNPSPDYHTFLIGDTSLDLLSLEDNCCDSIDMTIYWRIEFTDILDPTTLLGTYISHPDIVGTGQPSAYGSEIQLWGDGVDFIDVVHQIFYWVEDCNGNTTEEVMEEITITPRPEIIKLN